MTSPLSKDSLKCNQPRRTPDHPEKSHVVKACYDGQQKVIRFGEQGAKTAGKPKAGESKAVTQKRESFKARHAKNIAKGPSSAAYWADRVKWAEGGTVSLRDMYDKYERGGKVRPGEGLPDPSLLNLSLYADTVSREMFPGERENPQRDAARHMLASALAAQKTNPTIADLMGKAHEFKEAPFRTAGHWLGLSEPRADYRTDVHNNALGITLGTDKRSLRELLDAVEAYARAGTPTRQPGRASLEPDADTRYAEGGLVDPEGEDQQGVDRMVRLEQGGPAYAQGGLVQYDPQEIDTLVSQLKEEFHG